MEKKTLGSFLTALRKANGMTQKELADRLNVSDKAVSRWERDENCPDLTLIPVIADIFGVTSDELLRGERKTGDAPVSTEKSDRQIRHLVDNVTFRYIVGSLIAVVAAIGGLILQICVAINVGREPSERVVLAITTALMFGLWIAACMFVGLTYWSSCRKLSAAEDSEAAATGKKRIRKYFLGETVFLVALFVLLIGAVSDESGDFESSFLMFLVLLAVGALLVSPLPKRLWKHFTGYRLTTEKARRSFRRKAVVLSVLFVVLYVFVLYAGNVTDGAFFGPGKWFFSKESFCDYMSEVRTVDDEAQLGCVRLFGEPKIYDRWMMRRRNSGGFCDFVVGEAYHIGEDGPSFVYLNEKVDTVILASNPSMLPIRTLTTTGRDIGFAVWVVLWFAIPIVYCLLLLRARKKASLMGDEMVEKEENGDLS